VIQKIIKNLSNLPGWKSNRKIVVFESDDWGSIRMPSNLVREKLESALLNMGSKSRARYTKLDTLASENDLHALFETLSKVKDRNDKHPVFTAVSIVANPDFDKIRDSNYNQYFYEPFTTTLQKYKHVNAFSMWQEGVKNNLFVPQFHGREHLNVQVWMRHLLANDYETHKAFEQQCWGYANKNKYHIDYQAAFDIEFASDIVCQEIILEEGLRLFEELHGYKADFFVPPNGPFNNKLEETAAKNGIKYMSASKMQNEPQGEGIQKKRVHWLGQKNKHNQIYITRNCFFEPSDRSKDWVKSCLEDIDNAFKWNKPAVISSHRVNYIGGLDIQNRKFCLNELGRLLKNITEKWTEAEFITSSELGDIIKNKK
jgi:hypothetical protein